jgi:hypothetical protein
MSSYQIVCTEQGVPTHANHIIAVGTGSDVSRATTRWTVAEVLAAMRQGTSFYTVSPSTGKQARVLPYDCWCGRPTIRSTPDAVTDNNLDNLRLCRWTS